MMSQSPSKESGRRLSNEAVRSIFESIHNGNLPPPHLNFKIISAGPNGMTLSPPSYEFENGLYILLQAPKKRKKKSAPEDIPRAPPHLEHLMVHEQWPEVCPWQLSGPQFPKPTAIQQRYCYPKGDPGYSSKTGGALWTMYGADGKEKSDYRLLHVYYSAKRASNKGATACITADELSLSSARSPPKRPRRAAIPSAPIRQPCSPPTRSIYRPPCAPPFHFYHPTTPSSNGSTPNRKELSPRSLEALSSPPMFESAFVTPNAASTSSAKNESLHHHATQALHQDSSVLLTPSPFRRKLPVAKHNIQQSPLHRSSLQRYEMLLGEDPPFRFDDPCSSWHQDIDSYWNEPLANIMLTPTPSQPGELSFDYDGLLMLSPSPCASKSSDDLTSKSFSACLESMSRSLRQHIESASETEQPVLVEELVAWAKSLARNPRPLNDKTTVEDHENPKSAAV